MHQSDFLSELNTIFKNSKHSHNKEYDYANAIKELISKPALELSYQQKSIAEALIHILSYKIVPGKMKLEFSDIWSVKEIGIDDLQLIKDWITQLDSHWLVARYYDVLWSTFGNRIEHNIECAINAYQHFPIEHMLGDLAYWQRAIYLSKAAKRKRNKDNLVRTLAETALVEDCTYAITKLLLQLGEIDPYAQELSKCLANKAIEKKGHYLAESYLKLALEVKEKHPKIELSREAIIDLLCDSLQFRAAEDENSGQFQVSAQRYREAIVLLRGLNNQYKKKNDVQTRIQLIEARLVHLREAIQNQARMSAVAIEMDLSPYLEIVSETVKGQSLDELIQFPEMEYSHLLKINKARVSQGLFSSLFIGSHVYSDVDGRQLGRFATGSDEAKRVECFKTFERSAHFTAAGFIIPALRKLRENLKLDLEYFENVVRDCVLVPEEQKNIMSKALYHGYNMDFHSALMMLCPMVEAILRNVLKRAEIPTVTINETSESEKSMTLLLDIASNHGILNRETVFKAEALFTDPLGFNFRNKVAHGLIDDYSGNSYGSVYVWWVCLKWVYIYRAIR